MKRGQKSEKLDRLDTRFVRESREAIGLTPTDCASRLGIRELTWVRWEAGEVSPRMEYLRPIAKLLRCELERLFRSEVK